MEGVVAAAPQLGARAFELHVHRGERAAAIVGDDDGVRSSAISARDAQLALTDLLFILLVQRQPDANEHIRDSEMAVSALKQDAS